MTKHSVVLAIAFLLPGCSYLLQEDFDKATLVGKLVLGSPDVFKRSVTLPSGNAELILAVPNYRCEPIPDAQVTFTVRSSRRLEFSDRRSLSELTWAYGRDSCDAYGYLDRRLAGHDESGRKGMRLQISSDTNPISVEVDTSQIKTTPGRVAAIWFIYGDRAPGTKLWSNSDDSDRVR